jgi:hypothetical protein
VVGEIPTAAIFNTHVRDNLDALKNPPTAAYNVNEVADYSTSSASFVDIDATDLALAITTTGGDILVGFVGSLLITGGTPSGGVYFDVALDGTRKGGDDGICAASNFRTDETVPVSFAYLIRSVPAGAHTLRLQWRTGTSTTATLYAGAGTAGRDLHPQFWIREVS